MTNESRYLFLSCHPKFKSFANTLVSRLRSNGIRIWSGFDTHIAELERIYYNDQVSKHLSGCSGILAVVSEDTNSHVLAECRSASGKNIFVIHPSRPLPDYEQFFKSFSSYVLSSFNRYDYSEEFERLIRQLAEYSDRPYSSKKSINAEQKTSDSSVARLFSEEKLLQINALIKSIRLDVERTLADPTLLRPNSPDAELTSRKVLEFMNKVDVSLEAIEKSIADSMSKQIIEPIELNPLLDEISKDFREWITRNKPEMVDAVMRLTPATAFLGLLGLSGANMSWATPIILAVFGGTSVIRILSKLKDSHS